MKRTTLGPSLTTPKSSTTRGDLRALHAPTSSLLNLFRGICEERMEHKSEQSEHTLKPHSGKKTKRVICSALPFWQQIWSLCWHLEHCVLHHRSLPWWTVRGHTHSLPCIQSPQAGFSDRVREKQVSLVEPHFKPRQEVDGHKLEHTSL